jgi:hypothetical protein
MIKLLKNRLLKKLVITALLMVVASCATTYKAKVNFDKNSKVNTLEYKTFAWLDSNKIMAPTKDINPVMKVRIDDAIEKAFLDKGYQLISDAEKADFTISYTIGNRDKIKVSSYPAPYFRGFGWGRGYFGGRFGGIYGSEMNTKTQIRQYTEGKLAIDVYDVKTHQPAWHGWAVKRISTDEEEIPSVEIKNIVHNVVAQFN